MYVLAALACREARSDGATFDVVGAFNSFAPESFPARLAPFKLLVRLVWDVASPGGSWSACGWSTRRAPT